jgi:hypothetical protein
MTVIDLEQAVIRKLRSLPIEKQQEVLDFTEFLCHKVETINRRAFMQLPIQERRRILATQSEQMVEYYERNTEWREWTEVNIGDFHEYEPQT